MQYRSFNGLDKVQNFGGGQPRCLNFAKLRNAELQWLRFSLSGVIGDLLNRIPSLAVKWECDSVANITTTYNIQDSKAFKSILDNVEIYCR